MKEERDVEKREEGEWKIGNILMKIFKNRRSDKMKEGSDKKKGVNRGSDKMKGVNRGSVAYRASIKISCMDRSELEERRKMFKLVAQKPFVILDEDSPKVQSELSALYLVRVFCRTDKLDLSVLTAKNLLQNSVDWTNKQMWRFFILGEDIPEKIKAKDYGPITVQEGLKIAFEVLNVSEMGPKKAFRIDDISPEDLLQLRVNHNRDPVYMGTMKVVDEYLNTKKGI